LLHLAHARPGPVRHARHAARLRDEELPVRIELPVRHGIADVDHAFHLHAAFLVVHAAHHVAEPGDHARHFGQGPHFHDVLQLVAQVAHGEDALGQVFHRVLLVELEGLDVLHEAGDVAHAEQFADEGLRGEALEVEHVLPCAHEGDRGVGGGDGGDGAAPGGVAVGFGDDDGAVVCGFLEGFALRFGLLADGGVEDHDCLVGFDGGLDLRHFMEEVFFLAMAAGGIDDDDFEALFLEFGDAFRGDQGGVGRSEGAEVGYLCFCSVLFQLIECACSEGVGADKTRSEPSGMVMPC
ncbi:MAG: hypothetical protein LQ352_007226, partial [Teloschistes flavicans]